MVVFKLPFRPNYLNYALPVTYTEIWRDWIGAFAWSNYSGAPWPPALKLLKDQSLIGVIPTALAIGGWLLLSYVPSRAGVSSSRSPSCLSSPSSDTSTGHTSS